MEIENFENSVFLEGCNLSGAAARTGTGKKEKINEYGKKKVWKFV